MIDTLSNWAEGRGIAVAALYCGFLSQEEQTITNIMGAILKQLLGRGDIPKDLRWAFQVEKRDLSHRGLQHADLMRMLRIAIASLPQSFICIDALDECLPNKLPALLASLRYIVQECPRTRIFLTGRPHVKEAIERYSAWAAVVHFRSSTDDIRSYLEMRLDSDDHPEVMDNGLRADILRIILENMSDMCVGAFDISFLSTMYTYQRRLQIPPCFAKHRRYPRQADNWSEENGT